MIDVSQFQTRDPLVDFSIRFANDQKNFVADEIFTPQYVPKKQLKKYQYDLSNLREVTTEKDSKSEADTVDYGVFTTNATALLHKLKGEIDPADERDFDAAVADVTQDTAMTIMEKLLLRRERLMINKISSSANFASGLSSTLGAGLKWSDPAGDPEADAVTAKVAVKLACGAVPNALALSWTALQKLQQNAALKDRLKYTSGQSITVEQIKNLLGLQYLTVCAAQSQTTVEGATDSIADMWGTYGMFYVKNPSQAKKVMTFGRKWLVTDMYTYQYEDVKRGAKERIKMLEMGWWYTMDFAAVDTAASGKATAGYLLSGII